jgi:hypothetical protein
MTLPFLEQFEVLLVSTMGPEWVHRQADCDVWLIEGGGRKAEYEKRKLRLLRGVVEGVPRLLLAYAESPLGEGLGGDWTRTYPKNLSRMTIQPNLTIARKLHK